MTWRVGEVYGEMIFEMVGRLPSEDDRFVGKMETPELAGIAVDAYNRCLLRADTVAAEPWVPSVGTTQSAVSRMPGRSCRRPDGGDEHGPLRGREPTLR